MNHKLNIGKQIKHFGRVNQTIGATALRSLFLTKSRKETPLTWIINLTSVTAVAQCENKYKITHSPLRSITTFHFLRICTPSGRDTTGASKLRW